MMQVGTMLANRYRIDAQLGEGGMGVVYRAHDTVLDRSVAIKTVSAAMLGDESAQRLLREAQAAARLTHPNVVGVYDVVEDGHSRFIVMEYVDGQPLAALLPLDIARTREIGVQISRGLQYAHSRGIIHRDIKPENILVARDGTVKVMDFGLARSEGSSRLTQSGMIVGTVGYMAPEQILGGAVDARTDLYSVGCVLYEALTGRTPFTGDDPFAVLGQHINVMPVSPRWSNDAIPPLFDAVVMRLLAKDPAERYASAADVLEALAGTAGPEVREGDGRPPATTRTALLQQIVRGQLVGRDSELAEMREHLNRMISGEGRLVLLSGEPGIGKTRLAEELAVYAQLRGAWVLRGHCYEQDVGVPYLPFVESLRRLFELSGRALIEQLGERADDLGRFLPEIGRGRTPAAGISAEDERLRLYEAVIQWVSLASRTRPLMFILDDLHWADSASLRLLHQLARALRSDRVLFLGTYREMDLDPRHPLNETLGEMNRERLLFRLALHRLTETDTHALLSALFDGAVAGDLTRPIFGETEGNPFFLEEVVRSLVEEGRIRRTDGQWQRQGLATLEIPQSVKATIGRRLQKAGETCQRILTVAAVIGREFDPDILIRVSQLPEDEVLDALDEGVRLQLIRETRLGLTSGYAFEHALIRQTLYANLNPRRRARLHEQVGTAVESLASGKTDKRIEELAYHFGEAGLGVAERGIEYNLRAAAKAAAVLAFDEAERRAQVALELAEGAGDPKAQVRVLQALGDLQLESGDNKRAADAYERAVGIVREHAGEASDEILGLYLKFAEATVAFGMERPPQAMRYAQTTVKLLQDRPDQPRMALALSLLALHEVRSGALGDARQHAQEAITLATRLGATEELIKAYQAMASVHRSSNEWTQFREVVETRRSLRGRAFTALDVELFNDVIMSNEAAGDYRAAVEAARQFLELAEREHSPTAVFRATHWLGAMLLGVNEWDEAFSVTQRAIELGYRLRRPGLLLGWSMAREATILLAQGRESEARESLTRIEALTYEIPPEHMGPRLIVLNVVRRLGDEDLLRRFIGRLAEEQPRCLTCAFLHHLSIGLALLCLGDRGGAQARLEAAEGVIPKDPDPDTLAELAWLRAHIAEGRGEPENAVRHAVQLVDLLDGKPMDYQIALRLADAGRILHRSGTPEEKARGRALLDSVRELYRTLGARRDDAAVQHWIDAIEITPN